nr:uncharacterized protein CTRU02_00239 [Colletotrichum truncatum]KAF6801490.1 hypothetical protein CTRU02_00239 [Colletotrichum truncatum]
MENIETMVGSLGQFINRTAAHEHTAKCTVEETHRCALEWTTRDKIQLSRGVAELTQKTVVRTLMGDDFYNSSDELLAILHELSSDMKKSGSSILRKWLPHSADWRAQRAVERIRDIFTEKLMRRDATAVAGGPIESDLQDYVTYMLNGKNTAQLKHLYHHHHAAIMFAAQSSTASAITLVITCLLRHPDMMNAVKRDARSGDNHPVLLQACIKETIRYYKDMACSRQAQRDTASKESVATLSASLPYHSPAGFHHSDSWMPGRWLNAENKLVDVEEKGTKEGLGGESKQCPGENVSMIIITQALTTLLRCYDISWASPTQPRIVDFEAPDLRHGREPWHKVSRNATPTFLRP